METVQTQKVLLRRVHKTLATDKVGRVKTATDEFGKTMTSDPGDPGPPRFVACPLLCSAFIQSIMGFFEDWPHFERLFT